MFMFFLFQRQKTKTKSLHKTDLNFIQLVFHVEKEGNSLKDFSIRWLAEKEEEWGS